MAVTTPTVLPGNLLSPADCDFETGTPTWSAMTNASGVSVTSSTAVSGT